MTTNYPNSVDGDVLKELRNRYAEPKIPKCRICGCELSVQRAGGGGPTIWACSGMIDDPTGERNWIYAEGRSCADEHYERSRWTDYRSGGDSDVIDLIDAYQALLDGRLNATAQPVRLPTTRLWAGKVDCYSKEDVISMLKSLGLEVSE